MNITPDQADQWMQGATDGPWTASESTGFIAAAEGEQTVLTAERGDWWCEEDHRLAAAAPDLAQTIAGMKWQWGVERAYRSGTETAVTWFSYEGDARQEIDNPNRQHGNPRLVRRLVGPVEVAE